MGFAWRRVIVHLKKSLPSRAIDIAIDVIILIQPFYDHREVNK